MIFAIEKFQELVLKQLGTLTEVLTDVQTSQKSFQNQQQTLQDQLAKSEKQVNVNLVKQVLKVIVIVDLIYILFIGIASLLIRWSP